MTRKALPVHPAVHAMAESLETRRLLADPMAEDQLLIELVNKARTNPAQFAIDYNVGVPLTEFAPETPLAVSPYLTSSAQYHAYEMANYDYFAHQSPITGKWPDQMAVDAGYRLNGWPPTQPVNNNSNSIESMAFSTDASYGSALAPLVALLNSTDAQRLLDNGGYTMQEIGVGHGVGFGATPGTFRHYWVIHIAHRPIMPAFLTGVAFTDALTPDNFYTVGEGISGTTITARRVSDNRTYTTNTFDSGGYSIELEYGTYNITASGAGFPIPLTLTNQVVGGVTKKDFKPFTLPQPVVVATGFERNLPSQRITFTFSQNVIASLSAEDITVTDVTHGGTVPVNTGVLYNAATNTGGFEFAGTPKLPDGRYRAVLSGADVTNSAGLSLGADVTFDFVMLRGDANGDGSSNFDDLLALAGNFGCTVSGDNMERGDFDFDGTVDFDDLLLLAQNYGTTLSTTLVTAPAKSHHRATRALRDVLA